MLALAFNFVELFIDLFWNVFVFVLPQDAIHSTVYELALSVSTARCASPINPFLREFMHFE